MMSESQKGHKNKKYLLVKNTKDHSYYSFYTDFGCTSITQLSCLVNKHRFLEPLRVAFLLDFNQLLSMLTHHMQHDVKLAFATEYLFTGGCLNINQNKLLTILLYLGFNHIIGNTLKTYI